MRVDFTSDMEFHPERMSVQLCAFVPGCDVGQPVRGFESEDFENVHERALRIAGREGCGLGKKMVMGAIE